MASVAWTVNDDERRDDGGIICSDEKDLIAGKKSKNCSIVEWI
jgi:hypothetical protein